MSKLQLLLPGVGLAVLGMFGETFILQHQYDMAEKIAVGIIGALNLTSLVANAMKAPSA